MATNRWMAGDVPRGEQYDRRFEELEASGTDIHGEAELIDSYGPGSVLDAGCGTGRVAIELHRRGHRVTGIDVDQRMLVAARQKAPSLKWVEADLADPNLSDLGNFDIVVMAGNVLIFVAPDTEEAVVANMGRLLNPGGRLITGYSLRPGGFSISLHDELASRADLILEDRWSTWDRRPFVAQSDYAVSVHRRLPYPAMG